TSLALALRLLPSSRRRAGTEGGNRFSCHQPPSCSKKSVKKARPHRGVDGPSRPGKFLGRVLPGTVRGRSQKITAASSRYHRRSSCEPKEPHQGGEVE